MVDGSISRGSMFVRTYGDERQFTRCEKANDETFYAVGQYPWGTRRIPNKSDGHKGAGRL